MRRTQMFFFTTGAIVLLVGTLTLGLLIWPGLPTASSLPGSTTNAADLIALAGARASLDQARYAAASVLLSALTLAAAVAAAFYAWRAAVAGREANRISDAAREDQNRALATTLMSDRAIVFLHVTKKLKDDNDGVTGLLGVTFKNFGRTPALLVEIRMNVGFFDRPPAPNDALTRHPMPSSIVVPVDGEWPYKYYFPPAGLKEAWLEYAAGRRGLYLYGEVLYRDVYGHTHRTWLSRVFDGRSFVFGTDPEHEDFLKPELNGWD